MAIFYFLFSFLSAYSFVVKLYIKNIQKCRKNSSHKIQDGVAAILKNSLKLKLKLIFFNQQTPADTR